MTPDLRILSIRFPSAMSLFIISVDRCPVSSVRSEKSNPYFLLSAHRRPDDVERKALSQVFLSDDEEAAVDSAEDLSLEMELLRQVGQEGDDLAVLVGADQEVAPVLWDPVEEVMEERRPVEIGERGLAVFVAPGGVGHALQALVIAAKGLDGQALELAHGPLGDRHPEAAAPAGLARGREESLPADGFVGHGILPSATVTGPLYAKRRSMLSSGNPGP